MLGLFNLNKSGYYRWLQQPISKRAQRECEIDALIELLFFQHKSRYGACRITLDIKQYYGIAVKRNYVAKRMQLLGLHAKARRKFNVRIRGGLNPSPLGEDLSMVCGYGELS